MEKKYNIIYADPPWHYQVYSKKGTRRSAESHYQTMTIDEICALPVGDLADDDCALFLWVTFPTLHEVFRVLKSWGFVYKTVAFVWVKLNKKKPSLFWGMGFWTRANAEICILATKGRLRRQSAKVHQIVTSPIEIHSKKPDIIREKIIELLGDLPRIELLGDLPRIELFARQATDGWDIWGNEVENSIEFPT